MVYCSLRKFSGGQVQLDLVHRKAACHQASMVCHSVDGVVEQGMRFAGECPDVDAAGCKSRRECGEMNIVYQKERKSPH